MAENKINITDFSTHMRMLIARYKEQKQELARVKAELKASQEKCEELKLMLSCAESDYYNLKTAKMLEVGDGDIEAARARITKLIRDVNKCIQLINNQEIGA